MSRDTRMRNDDLALCLWAHDVWGRNISETVRDRDLGPKEMTHPESNGHVTDDVTWPWNVKVLTPMLLEANISKQLEIQALFQRITNR